MAGSIFIWLIVYAAGGFRGEKYKTIRIGLICLLRT
jgi:hypothetical protein